MLGAAAVVALREENVRTCVGCGTELDPAGSLYVVRCDPCCYAGVVPAAESYARRMNRLDPDGIALLGTMSDGEVAGRVGLRRNRIFQIRQKLGIPAFRRTRPGSDAGGVARRPIGD